MATVLEYLKAAMAKANYEEMEDGRYFATIPSFDGLWAVGETKDEAAQDLYQALEAWLDAHIKIAQQRPPEIDGVDLFAPPKLVEN